MTDRLPPGLGRYVTRRSHLAARFWNGLAWLTWGTGKLIERAALPFFGLAGQFDARADNAGWWDWHTTGGDHA